MPDDRAGEGGGFLPNHKCRSPLRYEGKVVGEFAADILVEGIIILELKSVKRIVRAHEIQLVNYLTATHTEIGPILNFLEENVEVKRKVQDFGMIGLTRIENKFGTSCYPVRKYEKRLCVTE